jgi:uncharacterized protein (DUF1800 family)
MQIRLRAFLTALLVTTLVLPAFPQAQQQKPRKPKATQAAAKKVPTTLDEIASQELTRDEAIMHVLNRLGYGPRPGDVERVAAMGIEKYVEQQLNPSTIDNTEMDARLKRYTTLARSSGDLMKDYPQANQAAKRLGITPEEYRARMEAERAQQQAQMRQAQLSQGGMNDPGQAPGMMLNQMGPQRIVVELSLAKLTRAIYSDRQLEEQLTDFWFNHFNVFSAKGEDRYLLTHYENETIRPRVLGHFRDLLGATAQDPAMLFYLDNFQSVDPKMMERNDAQMRRIAQRMTPEQQQQLANRPRRGLNENYARELMELHTLGVDGGYTQKDVVEVARCFTGWGIRTPRQDPEFQFQARVHDPEPKMVLGQKIDAGDKRDGEQVLDLLSKHPSTAKFVSTKLARRFVSDNPPPALVSRMADTFLKSDGDLRAVMHTMIWSPEFWSKDTYRAKIKKPFELVASAVRATGAQMDLPLPLVQWTDRIGEPLYRCQPPTGYSDTADAWVNTGALLNRMNFALALTSNRLRGVKVDLNTVLGDPSDLSKSVNVFLAGQLSPETRSGIEKQLAASNEAQQPVNLPGLVLGSPEFQRR